MSDPPRNIRRFEVLSLASAFVGIIHTVVDGSLVGDIVKAEGSSLVGAAKGHALGATIGAAIGNVVGVGIFILLTLLVSRGRKNWARWTLAVVQLSGAAFVAWQGLTRTMDSLDDSPAKALAGSLATTLVWLMQIVALVLVFTPQSTRWLGEEQIKQEQDLLE